jgi:short-subunit dehydrogenase
MEDFFRGKTVCVIGANSDIAKAFAARAAKSGCRLKLYSRDIESLENFLKVENIAAECTHLDITDTDALEKFADSFGGFDGVIIAAGYSPKNNCGGDTKEIARTIAANYTGCVLLLEMIKGKLKDRRGGFVSVISSLAGERGKMSNSVYASAKSGLTAYMEGLEQELSPYDIPVSIVKPAWVKTKMTEHDARVQQSFTSQTADQVAKKMRRIIAHKKSGAFYTSVWAFGINCALKMIPGFVYRRLSL